MDFLRQSRYLIPPFLLLVAAVSAGYLNGAFTWQDVKDLGAPTVALLIAFVGAATLPIGFFIGGLAVVFLRLGFWIGSGRGQFEAKLSDEAWTKIWSTLNTSASVANQLYASISFEGEQLSDTAREWVDRRWNAFSTYANCLVVLLPCFGGGLLFLRPYTDATCWWLTFIGLATALCVYMGILTWKQTMAMMEFNAHRVTGREIPRKPSAASDDDG